MSVKVYADSRDERLRGVRYVAAHRYYYGTSKRSGIEVPAAVSVDFSSGSLVLEIEDAHVLMESIAVALVEHAVTLKDSVTGAKAVA
ncbi:MAG: hypothetical protein JWN03_1474 [Nocardia sp.]|uniref:hypothetical protein n=1 Tax=Nocardia sp. TaxID=1821 RepID=UPI0026268E70|nr:hypothetical protein [Nocardia sp.]MCU1641199.1 hypothetical protein [Nocardia sp.]